MSQNITAMTISNAKKVGRYKRNKRGGSEVMWLYKCKSLAERTAVTRRAYWNGVFQNRRRTGVAGSMLETDTKSVK